METVGLRHTEETRWCFHHECPHPISWFYTTRGERAECKPLHRARAFENMRKLRAGRSGTHLLSTVILERKPSFEVHAYHPMQQDILAEVAEKMVGGSNKQVDVKRGLFYLGELLDEPGVYTLGETRNLRTRYSGHQRDRTNRDFRYIRIDGVDGFYDLDRKRLEAIGLRLFEGQFNRRVGSDGVLTDWYDIPTREQAIEAFKKICLEHSTTGKEPHANLNQPLPSATSISDPEADGFPDPTPDEQADDCDCEECQWLDPLE